MTWQERRTVTILSTILAILCAALLIVLGIRYQAGRDLSDGEDAAAIPGAVTDSGAFTSLYYSNGSTTLSFSLDEETGAWVWDADTDFPLDDATITAITELLVSWRPQQTITDSETLETCGMDKPTATLSAGTAQGDTVTMLLGNATTDGASYYMRYNGDETTVYIIDGGLYDLLCVPIYDMCVLPELPALPESLLRSVVIRGSASEDAPGVTTVLTAQRADGEDADTTWRSGGANVTDDETVRAILSDLESLAFEKCVDYRPSDEAASICGFDEPAAELTVNYLTDSGAEETLVLTIGSTLPDGSGRYTRLGEDTTIYLLSTETLDPLMRVSVNGLEG